MFKNSHPPDRKELPQTLERCLPRLQALALNLDTYGDVADAEKLQEVIEDIERAAPNWLHPFHVSMDFVVNGTFKVSRQQVARTLWHAFTGAITWSQSKKQFRH